MFVDNIYRYTLAGTEVSALLGRMPSQLVTNQRLQRDGCSKEDSLYKNRFYYLCTSFYVPADDLTDPLLQLHLLILTLQLF